MKLNSEVQINIRFSEVDSMAIVWHGNYIKYFEDGREDFGRKFGLGYMDIYANGFLAPIVKVECNYKRPVKYDQFIVVKTDFINLEAAKIKFNFTITDRLGKTIYATGTSEQVFITKAEKMVLNSPDFFIEWKRKQGLLTSSN